MQHLDELERERLLTQLLHAEAQGLDAGTHLTQMVARDGGTRSADLVEVQVREADVGPLDAGGAERLLALERRIEKMRCGQPGADAGELAERGVGA